MKLFGAVPLLLCVGAMLHAQGIVPEPLPSLSLPGFHFPESEATITNWVAAATGTPDEPAGQAAYAAIHTHAWGLWTEITAPSSQFAGHQALRVFETWMTPQDMLAPHRARVRTRSPMGRLSQFRMSAAASRGDNDRPVGYVKYDPTAQQHIVTQDLLHTATLSALLAGGAQDIPPFPVTSLAVKPIFQVFSPQSLVGGRYYPLKVWEGPPATPQSFGPSAWQGVVWIDVYGGGSDSGAVDPAPQADGSTRTAATTYPLSSFMWVRLTAAEAAGLNADKPGTNAAGGDYAVLVGMHVAGREIVRWTWQTFWWTPDPANPPAPSSPAIAALRPAELTGAPSHYALATAYAMQAPVQPVTGGENAGRAIYAYNPWVEAAFAPSDLPDSLGGNACGVQSNCMSCHIRASFNPSGLATAPRFAGARYTDLGDPAFVGTLQVDFLWSLSRNAR